MYKKNRKEAVPRIKKNCAGYTGVRPKERMPPVINGGRGGVWAIR